MEIKTEIQSRSDDYGKCTNSGPRQLARYGEKIYGLGIEAWDDDVFDIAFTYELYKGEHDIPNDLIAGYYVNNSTDYNSLNGTVSCSYTSMSTPAYGPFTVKYSDRDLLAGAAIVEQSANSITLGPPF